MANNEVDSDLRRDLEARQGRVITQTIVRPTTTFTTYVTLGIGPPGQTPEPPPVTTPIPQPAPTVVVLAPANSSSSDLTSEQLGAILGSVFGFIFLLLVLCACLSLRRRGRRARTYYSSSESSEDDRVYEVQPGPVVDPWTKRRPPPGTRMPGVVPPPVTIPPTPRHSTYRQTRQTQIRGVRRYP